MKIKQQYDQLFEDLMSYSDFTSTDQIQTQADLRKMFKDIQTDANSRGRKFPLSKSLVFNMASAFRRVAGRGLKVESRRNEVIQSKQAFRNFKQAREAGLTTTFNNKEIFKSFYVVKGKSRIVWRDARGRFSKKPSLEEN